MTPLEQFNEEEGTLSIAGIPRRKLTDLEKLSEDFVSELHEEIRINKGISDVGMQRIFDKKLTEHKALILKMVREKVPNQFLCLDTDREIGWNDCRQEFLNNLDTI